MKGSTLLDTVIDVNYNLCTITTHKDGRKARLSPEAMELLQVEVGDYVAVWKQDDSRELHISKWEKGRGAHKVMDGGLLCWDRYFNHVTSGTTYKLRYPPYYEEDTGTPMHRLSPKNKP